MYIRSLLLAAATLIAVPLFAADACPPWFTGDQCLQMLDDYDEGEDGGGSWCRYQMCGNAKGASTASYDWCEATQTYSNCPIAYCVYEPCVGTNCTPITNTCAGCASRMGNTTQVTACSW